MVAAGASGLLELCLHPALAHRIHQCGVVALVLVRVGDRERGDRVREDPPLPM